MWKLAIASNPIDSEQVYITTVVVNLGSKYILEETITTTTIIHSNSTV